MLWGPRWGHPGAAPRHRGVPQGRPPTPLPFSLAGCCGQCQEAGRRLAGGWQEAGRVLAALPRPRDPPETPRDPPGTPGAGAGPIRGRP